MTDSKELNNRLCEIMTKKNAARTALVEVLAERAERLAERDEIAAVVRDCFQRAGTHFRERRLRYCFQNQIAGI